MARYIIGTEHLLLSRVLGENGIARLEGTYLSQGDAIEARKELGPKHPDRDFKIETRTLYNNSATSFESADIKATREEPPKVEVTAS